MKARKEAKDLFQKNHIKASWNVFIKVSPENCPYRFYNYKKPAGGQWYCRDSRMICSRENCQRRVE